MPRRSEHPGVYVERRRHASGTTWIARGPVLGRTHNLTRDHGVTTRAQAVNWAIKEARRRRGRVSVGLTVRDAVEAYVADLARSDLAPSTVKSQALAAQLLEANLGPLTPTDAITRQSLHDLRRGVLDHGGTPGTQRTYLRRLARVLRDWHRQDLCPLIDRDAIHYAFSLQGKDPKEWPRCLSHDEIRAMLEATDHPLPRWLLLTGQRVNEALALRWEHVHLDRRVIAVPAEITKTKVSREIQLRVCPSLEDWLADEPRRSPLIFRGETYHSSRRLLGYYHSGRHKWLDRGLRDVVPGLRWKDLRSTCASYMHSTPGIPLSHAVRAQQLGHSLPVAMSKYVRSVLDIPEGASTLEESMRLVPVQADLGRGDGKVIRMG